MLCGVAPTSAAAPKRVLILSEGPVLPNGAVLRESIIAALHRDSPVPLNIHEELIDRVRFPSAAYNRQLVALYKAKYADPAPDVVITITEPAFDFALRHRAEIFPTAALLFGAVDERAIGDRGLAANVTGVFQHYDARATVEAGLALHPRAGEVVVVGGSSRLDRGYVAVAKEELRGLTSRAAFTYLTDKSLSEVLAAVAALRDDALVLFLSMQVDREGVARTGPEVLAALRGVATVPIYGMSGNFLSRGIVGGLLFDVQGHGSDIARRAVQILSGVHAADLEPMRSLNTLRFDSRELKRFGIDERRLPANATVVNREVALWDAYANTLFLVGAALIGQSLLIGGLLLQRVRRRRAERALHDLSGRLLSAQEDERRRIARELHDNLSQQMAALSIGISQVVRKLGETSEPVARSMRDLGRRTAEISTEIHTLSHHLHSSKLAALGLVEALRGHCQEVTEHGLRVQFDHGNVPRALPHDVEICLFRIVQEALNNVVKHSRAREVHVTLRGTGHRLAVTVADSGRGFDADTAAMRDGLGLASMRERARIIQGELIVRSQPGQGTTITATVAIPKVLAALLVDPAVLTESEARSVPTAPSESNRAQSPVTPSVDRAHARSRRPLL